MTAAGLSVADVVFLHWLVAENGHCHVRVIGGRRWASVIPRMFGAAIQVGRIGDEISVDDHWCYSDIAQARAALETWDGVGEPAGWHRHPATGRRVSSSADEVDENRKVVGAAGVAYFRR